jgi:hypothetical protein
MRVDLVCKDGKLKLNGKTYRSGADPNRDRDSSLEPVAGTRSGILL